MRRDTAGSEGISALLIFIVLVLIAATISTIIIATGEKLMRFSSDDAHDTEAVMYGKIIIIDMIVSGITYDANNDPTSATMLIIFELTPGSPTVADTDALWSVICPDPAGVGLSNPRLIDSGDFDPVTNATGGGNDNTALDEMETGVTYVLQIGLTAAACAPNYQESHTLVFGFTKGGGASSWSLNYGTSLLLGDRLL